MKQPAFQFYPADWLNDIRLRGESFEIKGFLIDIMCLLHQSEKYGFLTKEFEETLPRLLGKDRRTLARLLREVEEKSLLLRDVDTGELYSKRMVHDERIRRIRSASGIKGGNPKLVNLDNQKVNQSANQKSTPSSSFSSSKKNKENRANFVPPSLEEVKSFCLERNNGVDAERWFNFYKAKDWMIGKNKMKDWRAAVRTWENNEKPLSQGKIKTVSGYTFDA